METVCFSETFVSTYKSIFRAEDGESVTTQKNDIDIFINVRISNLKNCGFLKVKKLNFVHSIQ
jgi:hypothetical protein